MLYMFLFCVGVLYSPVFITCSPRYLCPPRVPISQLTLCYIATNITQQTQTTHREGSVAGLGPVFIQFSAVRARAQPADISLYTASVSSMPRCFMAKKLKYPYQQWKETKLEEDQDDHVAPVAAKSFPGSHHLDCFLRCVDWPFRDKSDNRTTLLPKL